MSETAASARSSHVSALYARHAALDAKLERESQRPLPDLAEIAALKKAKLKIKDALTAS